MTILLDVDGVLRDWNWMAIKILTEWLHIPRDYIDISKYNWMDKVTKVYPNAHDVLFKSGHLLEHLQSDAKPYPWANDLYKFCVDNFKTVRIVSHQEIPEAQKLTIRWLSHNVWGFAASIYFTGNKYEAKNNGSNLLIDDKPKNLDECRKAGINVLCIDQPWNQEWKQGKVKTAMGMRACNLDDMISNLKNAKNDIF
jgi:hypothetical protein